VADLRVDYQLLAATTSTLHSLSSEFANIDDQVSGYDPDYGSGAVAAAMGSFSGNWSSHRKSLLGSMQSLGQLTEVTEREFRRVDSELGRAAAGGKA
jgi:hypothetical protein